MDHLTMSRLRMQDFPNKSFYCIQQKTLNRSYFLHQHDFFEIEFVLSGKGEHFLNGHIYPLARGSAYFLNLNDFHELYVEEPIEVLTIMFSDHWVNETSLYRYLSGEADMQTMLDEQTLEHLLLLTSLIQDEYESTATLRDVALRNMTEMLLIRLLRCFEPELEESDDPDQGAVARVIMYLNAHFRENPTLSSVSEMVSHNLNYFSELFHRTTGKSYIQYLTLLKLNHARKLLTSTQTSITDIALASGFNSYSSFSHAFRETYGCSAYDFRKRERQSKNTIISKGK